MAFEVLNRKSIDQYVAEEHAQMARRAKVEADRLRALLRIMRREEIAPRAHVATLAKELDRLHGTDDYQDCKSMGELTAKHIMDMLEVSAEDPNWNKLY